MAFLDIGMKMRQAVKPSFPLRRKLEARLPFEPIRQGNFELMVTRDPALIQAAQALRYQVFYEEGGACATAASLQSHLDQDMYDPLADHLIVIDHGGSLGGGVKPFRLHPKLVGTYRLIRSEKAALLGGYYSAGEFDLSRLIASGKRLLELGRSCVHRDYRNRQVMDLLWRGLSSYIRHHKIDAMFGCASFPGVEIDALRETFSYLHHYHRADEKIRPMALPDRYIPMNWHGIEDIDPIRVLRQAPPLIKGYLRVGAVVGDGAVIDPQFQTTDICIIVETDRIPSRYQKRYEAV